MNQESIDGYMGSSPIATNTSTDSRSIDEIISKLASMQLVRPSCFLFLYESTTYVCHAQDSVTYRRTNEVGKSNYESMTYVWQVQDDDA